MLLFQILISIFENRIKQKFSLNLCEIGRVYKFLQDEFSQYLSAKYLSVGWFKDQEVTNLTQATNYKQEKIFRQKMIFFGYLTTVNMKRIFKIRVNQPFA